MNTGERKKKPRERIYANILFYGFIMRGLHLRPSAPARKAFFWNCKRVLQAGGMRGLLEMLLQM